MGRPLPGRIVVLPCLATTYRWAETGHTLAQDGSLRVSPVLENPQAPNVTCRSGIHRHRCRQVALTQPVPHFCLLHSGFCLLTSSVSDHYPLDRTGNSDPFRGPCSGARNSRRSGGRNRPRTRTCSGPRSGASSGLSDSSRSDPCSGPISRTRSRPCPAALWDNWRGGGSCLLGRRHRIAPTLTLAAVEL